MHPADIALALINPVGFLTKKLVELSEQSGKDFSKNDLATIPDLQEHARREEIQLERLAAEAKVAQEIAIARRIEHAYEVEIEEFYDLAGEGSAGVKADGQTLSVGVAGSGKRVTKRVFKFSGFIEAKTLDSKLLTSGSDLSSTENI